MSELKSAWEIAQDKANRLGKLSAEEKAQQVEDKCRQTGQSIARRWLERPQEQSLTTEMGNYPEEERGMIRRATLDSLMEAINFGSPGIGSQANAKDSLGIVELEKASEGIVIIEPESKPVIEQVTKLVQEYEQEEGKKRQDVENKCRETLHKLRISGTAVGNINIEATQEWQEACQGLANPFEPRLNGLKQELITLFA